MRNLHLLRLVDDVMAGHHGRARGRAKQGAQHPQKGGFPAPFGPRNP